MKENMQRNLKWWAFGAILLMCSTFAGQEQNAPYVETRAALANKVKQAIKSQEPKWKLTQHELIGVNFYQTWTRKGQKIKLLIQEVASVRQGSEYVRDWMTASSIGRGTRFDGLGDEAAYQCYSRPFVKGCAIYVRKGKVLFQFITNPVNMKAETDLKPLLELIKRFASHALTVDDEAMKAQN
jgi:hypothetical protein